MLRSNLVKLARGYSSSALSKVGNRKCVSGAIASNSTVVSRTVGIARFSTSEPPKNADKAAPEAASTRSEVSRFDPDEYDDYDEPKTAGQKVCFKLIR